MTRLQSCPISQQFLLMQFSPCLNKPLLSSIECASYQFNGLDSVNRYIVLVIGMKVRPMVRRIGLLVHADDYTEETAEFGHKGVPVKRWN